MSRCGSLSATCLVLCALINASFRPGAAWARQLSAALGTDAERVVRAAYADSDPFLLTSKDCEALHPNVLIYNRVHKAGSSTFKGLFSKLSRRNRFQYINVPTPGNYPSEQELITHFNQLCTVNTRCVYVNHMRYPPAAALRSLTERNLTFAFMNNIRRPIAQVRSHFEFSRWSRDSEYWRKYYQSRYNHSFSACVHDRHEACSAHNVFFEFFTSNEYDYAPHVHTMDLHVGAGTLLSAVTNIKTYAFVGLLERWQDTIAMAERVFPDFFRGASEVLRTELGRANVTPKLTLASQQMFKSNSEDARRIWYHSRFTVDSSLYDYMATRFHRQLESCGIEPGETRSSTAAEGFLFEMQ